MPSISRLLNLASKLSYENGATVQELMSSKSLGYRSRSSIYADIENLAHEFGLYVEKTDEKRGRTGREVVYKIQREDWNSFRSEFIQQILSQKDKRLLAFILEATSSTTSLFDAAGDEFTRKLISIVGGMTISPSDSKGYFTLLETRYLDMLLEAEEKHNKLYITYYNKKRELYPLKCFVFCGGIYCYVMSGDGTVYTLSVPRITDIRKPLHPENNPRPTPNINIKKALKDPFGIVMDKEEFEAVVKLSEWQGSYEAEKTWPESVNIEKKDGYYLFKVKTCGNYWLKRWVLSLGPEAELLKPENLRAEIKSELRQAIALY